MFLLEPTRLAFPLSLPDAAKPVALLETESRFLS
jgi:hypothetical protein